MYCSNCGSPIKPELNYCNRCGARISDADADTRKTIVENLSGAVGYVGSFGLIAFIFVILILVKNGASERVLVPISFIYLSALFGICFLLIQQVKSLSGKARGKKTGIQDGLQKPPRQMGAANTAQLGEARDEPAAVSVTENTTKTLDEVLLKRN